jgi:hypothetical protein
MSRRILSLWDIMEPFLLTNVSGLFAMCSQLEQVASTSPANSELPVPWRTYVSFTVCTPAFFLCAQLDLTESRAAIFRLKESLDKDSSFTNHELLWRLESLRELMQSEMGKRLYLAVPENVSKFYGKKRLFGEAVHAAFPSTGFDISQAGTCLACGLYTAAGFHLVRTAEIGLWELGRDRQIPLAQNNRIEFAEWGLIIRELEVAIQAIQQWPNSPTKEDAHKFYNYVIEEVRSFNDGWRRHLAHVRKSQKPMEEDEAVALLGHVQRFMERLAAKISEGSYTSLIW